MFCSNCGTENTDSAKFCKSCGKPLGNVTNSQSTEKKMEPETEISKDVKVETVSKAPKMDKAQVIEKIKSIPKMVFVGIGVAIVALIAIICVAVSARTTINLNKYITIETSGYDGYGRATATIDWDAIEEKYGDRISFTRKANAEYGGLLNYMTPVEILKDYISVSLEPSNGLSNGDQVTYTWNIDEELSTYLKCKVKYKDGTYDVSELTKVSTFDAFADLEVTFDGVAPNGSVSINYNGTELSSYDFQCEKTSGLSNGDIITIKINEGNLEYYAENLGMVPESMEKEYTVEGLSSYLTTVSEIDENVLAQMQSQASDVYQAHVAQRWGEGETLQSFTYMGNYLLTVKNTESYWGAYNTLYLVYKAQVRNNYTKNGKTYDKVNDIYWYIAFSNLMLDKEGKLNVNVTDYSTPNDSFTIDSEVSSGWFGTKTWNYYGYENLDALYKDVVAANMDMYNHQDNIDESVAPQTVEQKEVTTTDGFVFGNSDTVLLTEADLEGLTAEQCKIARNEIYARKGRKFQDSELQAYFDNCGWYVGTIEPEDFLESSLTEIEVANRDLIVAYEQKMGYE